MPVTTISIDDAIAQGSTWSQLNSVAAFHERMATIKRHSIAPSQLKKLKAWKVREFKRDAEEKIQTHQRIADYFRGLAGRLRGIQHR